MDFSVWFLEHLAKKDVDLCMLVEAGDGSKVCVFDVITYISTKLSHDDQLAIKDKLLVIELRNGNVTRFLEHLGKALDSSHGTQL
jgi:hypothetical protein